MCLLLVGNEEIRRMQSKRRGGSRMRPAAESWNLVWRYVPVALLLVTALLLVPAFAARPLANPRFHFHPRNTSQTVDVVRRCSGGAAVQQRLISSWRVLWYPISRVNSRDT